jgi:pyridoxine/pyridoxamine 5'-phosphate oxidase
MSIADIRKEYMRESLNEPDVYADPFLQFGHWWKEAEEAEIDEVNAMTLATAGKDGIPHARMVLLKDYSDSGFVFYTNYMSQKGREMHENGYASLLFFWKELERQVRITGRVEKLDAAESDAYFRSRPESSRIGAWCSPQSEVIGSRFGQISIGGYDHAFVLADKPQSKPVLAAEVYEPNSGRVLQVLTDQPGIQFYTATYTTPLKGKSGKGYDRFHGFCLETQHHPDSVHHAGFPNTILRPDETYRTATVHRFSAR